MSRKDRSASQTALIVEENLGRTAGHFDSWIEGMAVELQRQGLNVVILGSTRAAGVLGHAPVKPWFARSYLDAYLAASPLLLPRLIAALGHNFGIFLRLTKWFLQKPAFDLVVANHVNVFHLLAWRIVWLVFGRRKIQRLILASPQPMWLFYYDDAGVKHAHKGRNLVSFLYRRFASAVRCGDVALTAETRHDAMEIEIASGVAVVPVPTPRPARIITAARQRIRERRSTPNGSPVLGWLGRCSEEKGFSAFFGAVEMLLKSYPKLQFTILLQYLVGPDGCHVRETKVDQLAATDRRLRVIKNFAQGDDYGRLLGELDCLVLPYARRNYVGRNSSAALDAVLAGVPIITTEGTWMAELMIEYGAGFECKDQDVLGLALLMNRFVGEYEEVTSAAWRCSNGARAAISWSSFSEVVLG